MSDLSLIRQKYLAYLQKQGHAVVPSVNLVPENDPSTLFTSAGMQPMIPYFFGEKHPEGSRIANSQKCFRSEDIEEVGDNRHTTFFEMLGNWSFGDYFKKEQIEFVFHFLVDEIGLDPKRLYVSVFAGNQELDIPADEEAAQIWQKLFESKNIDAKIIKNPEDGMQGGRIFFYGEKKNWWSRSGVPANMPVGEPGGPDSEIFYDFSPGDENIHQNSEFAKDNCHINCDCGRFLEIGNSVFMQYQKTDSGFEPLAQQNIDFGGGLGRILAAKENQSDVFKTASFTPIIAKIEELSGQNYEDKKVYFRIIADHVKAAVMLIADGVFPSNKEQGYLLRRLIRRALRQAKYINIQGSFIAELLPAVVEIYQDHYTDLVEKKTQIKDVLAKEEQKFARTLEKGLREFEKMTVDTQELTADQVFKLYESYGFPAELSLEEAKEIGISLEKDIEEKFEDLREAHAAKSRQGSEQKFKGGLADQGEITTQYHTATHLLQAALRQVLGETVAQKGSNITAARLRFDFSHSQALTDEEKKAVEDQVNAWIKADLPVNKKEMAKTDALNSGAIAFFVEKYPDQVTVYSVGQEGSEISKEFCGGPHVQSTGEIGPIEIFKEKAASAGVRRIYARLKS